MELTTTIKTEYNSICRVCLVPSEDTNSIDIKMFEYCTGLNISENSNSTDICEKCDNSLKDFSSFKIKCIESHKSLIKMYSEKQVFEVWLGEENIDIKLFQESTEDLIEENKINKEEEILDPTDDESIEDDEMEQKDTSSSNKKSKAKKTNKNKKSDDEAIEDDEMEQEDTSSLKKKTKAKKTNKNKKFDLCMYCGKSYGRTSIYSHIQKVHMEALLTERHQCDQCEKTYKKKEALMRHQRFHKNVKAYNCNLCNESFLYWSSRRDHMVYVHSAPYKYNCELCDYKTQQSESFGRHKRKHTGELPFKCEECQKLFLDRAQLRRHMVTHLKEKNFNCEVCNKSFASKNYVKTHMRTHTQERNYWCPVESCGKSFIQNHVLKTHMKSNHPDVEIPPSGTIVSKKTDSKARKCYLKKD